SYGSQWIYDPINIAATEANAPAAVLRPDPRSATSFLFAPPRPWCRQGYSTAALNTGWRFSIFADRLGISLPSQARGRSVIVPDHLHMEESAVRQIPTALRTRLPAGGIVQKKASA